MASIIETLKKGMVAGLLVAICAGSQVSAMTEEQTPAWRRKTESARRWAREHRREIIRTAAAAAAAAAVVAESYQVGQRAGVMPANKRGVWPATRQTLGEQYESTKGYVEAVPGRVKGYTGEQVGKVTKWWKNRGKKAPSVPPVVVEEPAP